MNDKHRINEEYSKHISLSYLDMKIHCILLGRLGLRRNPDLQINMASMCVLDSEFRSHMLASILTNRPKQTTRRQLKRWHEG